MATEHAAINPSNRPELFTVRQVAELANVCERTVYRMIEDGQLRAVRVRNSLRISRAALRETFGIGGEA
ncbi:helix-turn-helix domain-containing protein [Thermophilibacter sp.]